MAVMLSCCHLFCFSQNRNSVWCFGDSALIDFSDTSNILVGSCALNTRGSCVSMSDENGKLLFYAHTRANTPGATAQVFDTSYNIMQNGDSIIGEAGKKSERTNTENILERIQKNISAYLG